MSEVLEGVLSETILDELASDLGIQPDVLRKHPFFRVYKGRVLLTYPLKSGYSTMVISDKVSLGIGEYIQVPRGHHLLAIIAGDADFASLKIQIWDPDGAYRNSDFALTGISVWGFVPVIFKSDGENLRITAVGLAVDTVRYLYAT